MVVNKIAKALIGSKANYEKVRAKIIKEKGYNYFREQQKKAFKKINSKRQ